MKIKLLLTGDVLKKRAEELGVVTTLDDPSEPTGDYEMFRQKISEAELQNRVRNAELYMHSEKMYKIAIVASIASVISAIAAWLAIL